MAAIHSYRDKDGRLVNKELTAMRAIRIHCLQCSNWNAAEVRRCVIPDCPLYVFRMGRNPKPGELKP